MPCYLWMWKTTINIKIGKHPFIWLYLTRKQWMRFSTFVCVSGGKKYLFFGKLGVLLFLETPVLYLLLWGKLRKTMEKRDRTIYELKILLRRVDLFTWRWRAHKILFSVRSQMILRFWKCHLMHYWVTKIICPAINTWSLIDEIL